MKNGLLIVAVLVAPNLARADALSNVCQRLIGSQVSQCFAAGNGRYIDGNAAQACGNLIGTQVISCVGAIAGKVYSVGEAQACGGLIGTQVVECFRSTGRAWVPVAAPPPPQRDVYPRRGSELSVTEIRAEVAAALEMLRARDDIGAERRLRRLLQDLR